MTEPQQVQAIEVDRVVTDTGNLEIVGQQVWLGPTGLGFHHLGISATHLHVLTVGGEGFA
ncbi:hypothetical protein [Nonomuraea sp. NPDC049784]|uniref:hypothetical protein n=1 Tax=Nonomuraea sp. NPDC049784 TaxID=3154361 RepID=UPI0033CEB6BE